MTLTGMAATGENPDARPVFVAGQHLSFVTCPIFRDAASQCWLAEHLGEVLYIGRLGMAAPPPQLLHRILVEGEVANEPRSCGGIVIQPLHLSVLPDIDNSCNTILNDNGSRPTEPSFLDAPPEMLNLIGMELPAPPGPYSDTTVIVLYGFSSTFLGQDGQRTVEAAAKYAIASKATHVEITGFASRSRLDDGTTMIENPGLADERARAVFVALSGLGVGNAVMKVARSIIVNDADGIHDADNRRVVIRITDVVKGKGSPAATARLPRGKLPPSGIAGP